MKLYSLETGNLMLDGGAMFGVVPKVLWEKVYPANEKNLCNLSMRSLLVIIDDKKILIDTGWGQKQDEKFFQHYYPNGDETLNGSLAKLGLKPEDITDVVHTHLHFDHCGGTIVKDISNQLVPAFPNATLHVSKLQWQWGLNPNPREKASFLSENLLPMKKSGKLNLIDKDTTLFSGFDVRMFHGHTRGQLLIFLSLNGKTIVHVGDLIPTFGNIPLSWISAYDIEPLVALKEKKEFLNEALSNNYILYSEHDIFHQCASLKPTSKGPRVKDFFKLNEVV